MSRFKRALETDPNLQVNTEYQYGMARRIPGDEIHFEFSLYGHCTNWELKKYDDVESYQSLDPVKCTADNLFYLYYKFKFK